MIGTDSDGLGRHLPESILAGPTFLLVAKLGAVDEVRFQRLPSEDADAFGVASSTVRLMMIGASQKPTVELIAAVNRSKIIESEPDVVERGCEGEAMPQDVDLAWKSASI